MLFGGVGARYEYHIGILYLIDGVGHGSGAERAGKPRNCGRMAEPGAVVHVVRPDGCTGEPDQDIVVLVGALCGAENGYGAGSISLLYGNQPAGNIIESLIPRYPLQFSVFVANHWVFEPVRVMDEFETLPPLQTEPPPGYGMGAGRDHTHDAVIPNPQIELATGPAPDTCCVNQPLTRKHDLSLNPKGLTIGFQVIEEIPPPKTWNFQDTANSAQIVIIRNNDNIEQTPPFYRQGIRNNEWVSKFWISTGFFFIMTFQVPHIGRYNTFRQCSLNTLIR